MKKNEREMFWREFRNKFWESPSNPMLVVGGLILIGFGIYYVVTRWGMVSILLIVFGVVMVVVYPTVLFLNIKNKYK